MITRKFFLLAFTVLLLHTSMDVQAQQTPKKTSTTKTTAKKPAAKKKPAKKSGSVVICDAANGYTYHTRRSCADLSKCKGRLLEMTKQEATGNYGRKPCKNCSR